MAPPQPNGCSYLFHIYKIDYVIVMKNFLNPKEHPNRNIGSKVMAILLHGWILPIGLAASGRDCVCSLATGLFMNWSKFIYFCKLNSATTFTEAIIRTL